MFAAYTAYDTASLISAGIRGEGMSFTDYLKEIGLGGELFRSKLPNKEQAIQTAQDILKKARGKGL